MRDLDFVEQEEPIVHGVVSELGADIANVDVLQGLMGLQIPDLDTERSRSIALTANNQLCHNNGVICGSSKRANPPFACCEMWGMDCECLVFWIPGSCCLQTTDIGSMTKLSLRIASDDLVVIGLGKPLLLLFWGTLLAQCNFEPIQPLA